VTSSRPTESGATLPRLFVAIEIPHPIADDIEGALAPWRAALPGVRWVPRENWHLTMRFLGSTGASSIPWVRARLAGVAEARAPFDTAVRGLGGFPSLRRVHVLWAGIDDDQGRLRALTTAIGEALAGEFPSEARPFTPHVTVGRSDERPLASHLGFDFGQTSLQSARFEVGQLVLMRSHLRRPAPVYERLEAFPLRAPA
jgi:2'-5' RNA ligase